MRLRLTRKADADIASILRTTKKLFGPNQVLAYARIIEQGMDMIVQAPSDPRCRRQDHIAPGVKSVHLDHAQGRRGSASHLIFFIEQVVPDDEPEIVVIGVLHENMFPRRHLAKALRDIP